MRRAGTTLNGILVGTFAAACIGALLFLAFNIGLRYPGQQGYRLEAEFAAASGLVPQDEVRISGVKVGSVIAVGPAADGRTLVTMELYPGHSVRRDVRAVIRPKSLLGTKYVELVRTPGSRQPELPSGATLAGNNTGEATEIDDILSNLDPPTRQAMSESLRQLGVALDGRAGDVNSSLPEVGAVAANLRPLAQVGTHRQEELGRILTDLDTIMRALADEQDSLGQVIDSGNRVFGGVAQRDQDLGGAIQNTNSFLASLDSAFSAAGVTAADRASLAAAPDAIAANQHTLSLTNGGVDQIIPEILLGQVNYPADQLSLSQADSAALNREWISAFYQHDLNGNSFRITNITSNGKSPLPGDGAPATGGGAGLPTLPNLPNLPVPTPSPITDPLCLLVGGHC
ncbi:MAG: hypothetical protein NVS9B1_03760 [Candidatus Dormibacteraceae bacterium]